MKIYVVEDNNIIEYYYENIANYEAFVKELDEEFEEWYPTIEDAEQEVCSCIDSIVNTSKLLPQSCDIPFEYHTYRYSDDCDTHNNAVSSRSQILELLKLQFSKVLFQKIGAEGDFLVWVS